MKETKSKKYRQFERSIDGGHGSQVVTTDMAGVILDQELFARSGYYTGPGNPELIGKNIDDVRESYGLYEIEFPAAGEWLFDERLN